MNKSEAVGILFGFDGAFSIILTVIIGLSFPNINNSWLMFLPVIIWAGLSLLILFVWVNVVCIKELLAGSKRKE